MFRFALAAFAALTLVVTTARAVDLPTPWETYRAIPVLEPEKPLACSFFTETTTRPILPNTGIYPSHAKGSQMSDLYCQHSSGFYGDIWNLTPFGRFGDGGEFDFRVGWTGKVAGFNVDVSGAEYNFRVNGVGVIDHLNGRLRVGYAFEVGIFNLEPFVLQDYQYSFFVHGNAWATAGGLVVGVPLSGNLRAEVETAVWQYYADQGFFASQHPTVWSIQPRLTYKIDRNWSAMFGGVLTSGDVLHPGDHDWKSMGRIRLQYSF